MANASTISLTRILAGILDLPYPGSNFNLDISDFANLNHVCISNGVFCEVTYDEHKVGYRKKESAHSVNPNA